MKQSQASKSKDLRKKQKPAQTKNRKNPAVKHTATPETTKPEPTASSVQRVNKQKALKIITEQDIRIAEQRAAGATLQQLATTNGFADRSGPFKRLQHPEIKAMVEAIQADLIATSIPQAADNIRHAVDQYRPQAALPADQRDTQLREHGFKASQRLLESIGILPTHTQSIVFQQLIQGNQITLGADITQVLSQLSCTQGMSAIPGIDDVIDADVVNTVDKSSCQPNDDLLITTPTNEIKELPPR